MIDWVGQGTNLPAGFAAFRVETNDLHASARVMRDPTDKRTDSAVQLLCRALRMAPGSYRRFELAAADSHKPLVIDADPMMLEGYPAGTWNVVPSHDVAPAAFQNVSGLAAAMQQYAAAEELSVGVSPDLRSVVICRAGDQLP